MTITEKSFLESVKVFKERFGETEVDVVNHIEDVGITPAIRIVLPSFSDNGDFADDLHGCLPKISEIVSPSIEIRVYLIDDDDDKMALIEFVEASHG